MTKYELREMTEGSVVRINYYDQYLVINVSSGKVLRTTYELAEAKKAYKELRAEGKQCLVYKRLSENY